MGTVTDAQSISRPTARRRRSALAREELRDGYLMMAPWLIGFIVLVAGPMIVSFGMAFTNWQIVVAPRWTGLTNFTQMFTKDELIPISLLNTAFYTFLSTPLYAIFGLALALVMGMEIKGVRFYRTVYFLPSISPLVATTLLWMLIFQADFGFANWVLQLFGLPRQMWLADPVESKPVLILMHLWGVGGSMPIFLAGLKGIPKEMYEAAQMDGAGRWRCFRNVTLPLLSPVLFFVILTGFIGGFQVFTQAFVATNGLGSPANSTMFYVLYLYNNAFKFFKMGYASAMAWLIFVIILAFTLLQFWISRRVVYYEDSRG